jgi:hypothetical protein
MNEHELEELMDVIEYWLQKDMGIRAKEKGIDDGEIYFYYTTSEPFSGYEYTRLEKMAFYLKCDFSFSVFPYKDGELWIELRFIPVEEEDDEWGDMDE